jgi:ABC-type phosphate transport system substrate-binding protein
MRLKVCGVVVAALLAAMVLPGGAIGAIRLPKCTEGAQIDGEGTTNQEIPQKEVWDKEYINAANKNSNACPGGPKSPIFKKWLMVVNNKNEPVVNGKTWLESAEEPPANTLWPEEAASPVIRGQGSGGMVAKVEETPGSIGYVNLANARRGNGLVPPQGGERGAAEEGAPSFWVDVENKIEVNGKKVGADPATNGDVAAKAQSNCMSTDYVTIDSKTGKVERGDSTPDSTLLPWNHVTADTVQTKYPLCGLSYDLALTEYEEFPATTKSEATTAGDFLEYVVNSEAEGGQAAINGNWDFMGLPRNGAPQGDVLKIAQEGASEIGF